MKSKNKTMDDWDFGKMKNSFDTVLDSIVRVYERNNKELKKEIEDNKIKIAIEINHLLGQAEKHKWSKDYINALKDLKKQMKITDSIYDLYR